MAFNADRVVNALEYDLRPHVEAYGTTPEPSDAQVTEFQFRMKAITDRLPSDGDLTDLTREEYEEISEDLIDAVAVVTGGDPTRDQIAALPFRIQRKYIDWLRGELTDPEDVSPVTKLSRADRRSAARIS